MWTTTKLSRIEKKNRLKKVLPGLRWIRFDLLSIVRFLGQKTLGVSVNIRKQFIQLKCSIKIHKLRKVINLD